MRAGKALACCLQMQTKSKHLHNLWSIRLQSFLCHLGRLHRRLVERHEIGAILSSAVAFVFLPIDQQFAYGLELDVRILHTSPPSRRAPAQIRLHHYHRQQCLGIVIVLQRFQMTEELVSRNIGSIVCTSVNTHAKMPLPYLYFAKMSLVAQLSTR